MAIRFGLSALAIYGTSASQNTQRCSVASGLNGKVLSVSDGTNERCIAVVAPASENGPLPILFWFHGSGGSAASCGDDHGNAELGQLAIDNGFALVCAEALQYGQSSNNASNQQSGLWQIPEVITDSSGTPCGDSDSIEVGYIKNAITKLGGKNAGLPDFDTTRIFTSGCSMGSAFSGYTANCLKARSPSVLSAFATHSTGLKTKGDGATLPPENYHPQYNWGECPTCEYFPFAPTKFNDTLSLKACVFDNTGDGDFYKTSKSLVSKWTALGMKAESHFGSGGHCEIHSYAAIVNCLDDGTKRLLSNGPAPAPSPGPSPPSPGPSPSDPPQACQTCFDASCGGTKKFQGPCQNCVQANQANCSSSCAPYPFEELLEWYCGKTNATNVIV